MHWKYVTACEAYLVEVCLTCCYSSRLPVIFINIYGVVCVQLVHFSLSVLRGYIHSSCYYHNQIGSINLTHYHIFPWLCAWDVCYIILCHLLHIIWENRDFVFIITVQFMMSTNSRIRFGLRIVFACLHITPSYYHHGANLSEDIELIRCLSDIFCRVCE